MSNPITILLVDTSREACAAEYETLDQAGFLVSTCTTESDFFQRINEAPPQVILLSRAYTTHGGGRLLELMKHDTLYRHIPILLLLDADVAEQDMDWFAMRVEDYVARPCAPGTLLSRVRLTVARSQREANANPLTGLPGNVIIMREADRRIALGEAFAMAYVDIDFFKAFNDKYGFARGDEVLRMTGRVLTNALGGLDRRDTFLGHVGGDDFIMMVPSALADRVCRQAIEYFDMLVPNFYDEADRERGEIQSVDRNGNAQTFPLMSVTIAVVDTSLLTVKHLGDISARAAEVKKFAKGLPGSNYLVDRRR